MEEATPPRNTLLIKELVTFSLDPPPPFGYLLECIRNIKKAHVEKGLEEYKNLAREWIDSSIDASLFGHYIFLINRIYMSVCII